MRTIGQDLACSISRWLIILTFLVYAACQRRTERREGRILESPLPNSQPLVPVSNTLASASADTLLITEVMPAYADKVVVNNLIGQSPKLGQMLASSALDSWDRPRIFDKVSEEDRREIEELILNVPNFELQHPCLLERFHSYNIVIAAGVIRGKRVNLYLIQVVNKAWVKLGLEEM